MPQAAFQALGTHWNIVIRDEISQEKEKEIFSHVQNRLDAYENDYSRFRPNSLLSRMSESSGVYTLPDDAEPLISLYQKLYTITNGLVTPLIGKVLVDAGYDKDYSLQKKELSNPPLWENVLDYHYPTLEIKTPAQLDFGGLGKGYAIDIVSQILETHKIDSYCVNAGGDVRYKNKNKELLRVGLEHPENKKQIIGTVDIGDESLCGSAGNRRAWADMHHIINPQTLVSPRHILALWARAENTLLADAMTTALFFTSPKILKEHFNFEYLILYKDYSVEMSENFGADLFTS